MKSTLRVDFKGPDTSSHSGFEPVIRVTLEESDDVRDKLLKTLFQSLGGESSWLNVQYETAAFDPLQKEQRITITPVKETDLELLKEIVELRINNKHNILR